MRTRVYVLNVLILIITICYGNDIMQPGHDSKMLQNPGIERAYQTPRTERFEYAFSIPPETIMHSYYDYMIGGFNSFPLCVVPNPLVGGYYMTYHARRTATGDRRVFANYVDNNGVIEVMSEYLIHPQEGYPSLALDPVTGCPLFAWHAETDNTNIWDVLFVRGLFGIENGGAEVIINNPITMPEPDNTTNNEFMWPTLKIGHSPVDGMRRVYVLAKNSTGHIAGTNYASMNVWICYADFNEAMIENDIDLVWNHTSIPILDAWNHSNDNDYRRFNGTFVVGNDDKIFYIGYHEAYELDTDITIVEPELDAFICDNFGQGTWQRVTGDSRYPSWNPPTEFGTGPGIFRIDDFPFTDDHLNWKIANSVHTNAVVDGVNNKIHMPGLWTQFMSNPDNQNPEEFNNEVFYTVKDLIYDVNSQSFSFNEIYPVAGTSSDSLLWLPWDNDGNGVVDEYSNDDPESNYYGYPLMDTTWPFPYWDNSSNNSAMFFHCNNIKITEPNAQGMMAAVWQDSNRARINLEAGQIDDTPEIFISISSDLGVTWSAPVSLNKNETPELANMKPMWVYPADKVKYSYSSVNGNPVGKLGLLFFDDISWGPYVLQTGQVRDEGGFIKFAELEIVFPQSTAIADPEVTPFVDLLAQNYPNPFNPETLISFQMVKAADCDLKIYNSKGQLVKTLFHGRMTKGEHKIVWNGTDNSGRKVSSGIYSYKIKSGTYAASGKMILLK